MIDGSYVFLMQISDIEVIYRKITIYNLCFNICPRLCEAFLGQGLKFVKLK